MVARLMAFDKNEDGKLTKDELPERMQSLLARADENEDGALTKEELLKLAEREGAFGGPGPGGPGGREGGPGPGGPGGGPGEFVTRFLEQNDANKDGKLSGDEIPERMRQNLARIDTNKDGEVDRAELEAMARNFGQGRGEGGPRGPGEGGPRRQGGPGDAPGGEGGRPPRPQRPAGDE